MKKFLKISGIFIAVLLLILSAAYFYLTNNTEKIIKDFVFNESNGKMTLDMKKVEFNLKSLHFNIIKPHFTTNDSLHESSTYDITAGNIVLDVASIMPVFFRKKLNIDTIIVMRPSITITKWKDKSNEKFSLPEQMGKVYNTLDTLLKRLSIKYCLIDSGSFSLVNKLHPELRPVALTDFYLLIDNFQSDTATGESDRLLFADRIKFNSGHQNIIFSDGLHGIQYRHLRINSKKQRIELDSCYVYGKNVGTGFNEFEIYFDTVLITHTNFNLLVQDQVLKADSALCINPVIKLHTQVKQKTEAKKINPLTLSKDSIEHSLKKLLGDIDVKYIGVRNGDIDIQTKTNDNIVPFKLSHTNFVIRDIRVIDKPQIPIHLGSFDLAAADYKMLSADSSYIIGFDSVHFYEKKVILTALAFDDLENNTVKRRRLSMKALEINGIEWTDLLDVKKVTAKEIIMHQPSMKIIQPEKNANPRKTKKTIFEMFQTLSKSINIQKIYFDNADIDFLARNKMHVLLDNVNAEIVVNKMLQSQSFVDVMRNAKEVSFKMGKLNKGSTKLLFQNGKYYGEDQSLQAAKVDALLNDGRSKISLNNFSLQHLNLANTQSPGIDNVQWQSASIQIQKSNSSQKKSSNAKKEIAVNIDHINAANTKVVFVGDKMKANVLLDSITATSVLWNSNKAPVIGDLLLKGKDLHLQTNTSNIVVQKFRIANRQPSELNDIAFTAKGNKQDIVVQLPQLYCTPSFTDILQNRISFKSIVLNQPDISLSQHDETVSAQPKNKKLPVIDIEQLTINNPVLNYPKVNNDSTKITYPQQSKWVLNDIRSDSDHFNIAKIDISAKRFSADTKKLLLQVTDEGNMHIGITGVEFYPATAQKPLSWKGTLSAMQLQQVNLLMKKNDSVKSKLSVRSLELGGVTLQKQTSLKLKDVIAENDGIVLQRGNFSYENEKSHMDFSNLQYYQSKKQLGVDSFALYPLMDKDSFMKTLQWQKEYATFSTGNILFTGFDPGVLLRDSVLAVSKITITKPNVFLYRDKRVPFQHNIIKPLPTMMVQKIKQKINIDSVLLLYAYLEYEEFNDKTMKAGLVKLYNTNALVTGIKNFDFKPNDSLRINANTRLLDTVFIKLRFNEAYEDTLHAFLLAIRTGAFNLPALNPILVPLVSAKANSGRLDTLQLTAIGREYVASGKMKMYYKNLKVQYLEKGNEEKRNFKTKFINFVANSFLIHKNKDKGVGNVFAERNREKGFVNYWLKIITSGVITNTGVQSNNKIDKKYARKIKKLKVPEIPEVDL